MTASRFRPRRRSHTVVTWTPRATAPLGRCTGGARRARRLRGAAAGDNDAALLDDLRRRFPNASCVRGDPILSADGEIFCPTSTTAGGRYRCQPGSCGARVSAAGLAGAAADPGRVRPAATARWQSIFGQPRALKAVAGACASEFAGGVYSLPPRWCVKMAPCPVIVGERREKSAAAGAAEAQQGGVCSICWRYPTVAGATRPARWCCSDCPRTRPALLQAMAGVASQVRRFARWSRRAGYFHVESPATSSCGALGWTTDPPRLFVRPGRPVTDQTWPPMLPYFTKLWRWRRRAATGGSAGFPPAPV